jgi:hypothetical protein
LKKGWIDDDANRIKADAFILRPEEGDGLSVNIRSKTNLEVWLGCFKKSYGADSLHTGRVRTLGLDVGQTEEDLRDAPDHAVITGLPYQDEDPDRAESLASELVKMSRDVDRIVRKAKKPV